MERGGVHGYDGSKKVGRRKLELHYTPKHRSQLNMAEVEISALERQCLKRRLASEEELAREVAVGAEARNNSGASVDWRFTTDNARIKLKRLYPSLQPCQ